MIRRVTVRAAGIAAGCLLDRAFADPRRGHPVALFGTLAARVEHRLNTSPRGEHAAGAATQSAPSRHVPSQPAPQDAASTAGLVRRGALGHTLLVGGCVALGFGAERLCTPARFVATAAATWAVLGGRTLGAEGTAVADLLDADDLPGARDRVTHLVGRITDELSADEVARAALESVAENSADAVVAPLFWGAVAGVPGLLGYRAINTLDAMWGHRTPRFDAFGRVAARVDDAANLAPARLTALLVAALPGVQAGQVLRVVRRDAPAHPSPNAGVVEAAFATALGVTLGGRNVYASGVEERGTLGDGPAPSAADLRRGIVLLHRVSASASVAAVVAPVIVALARGRRAGGVSE